MGIMKQPTADFPLAVRRLAKQLGLYLVESNRFFFQRMHQEEITSSQAMVLNFLLDNRAWRMSDLARAMAVRLPSMTDLVSRMERQGWVCKMETSHDRRGVAVTITEQGRALIQGFERRQIDLIAQQLMLLSDEDRVTIERAMPVLNRLFNDQEDFTD
ncbi:MAG: MarR family winged helix-turn-helix transcriptional regulator [Ktedonobacteraceae bacterium]